MADSSSRLAWAQRLQALAQTGLTYARDPYDIERYQELRRIAAEMVAAQAGQADKLAEDFAVETGYATPKTDVRGAVWDERDRLLLVKERSDGLWTLPGGWADVGVSPADNVVREIYEEAGFRCRATRLLAVYDRARHGHPPMFFSVYKMFFACEIIGGEAAVGGTSETDGVGFYALEKLPPLSTGRVTAAQIARLYEHHHQPDLPTDFD